MSRIKNLYSEKLVQRVNELYHDLINNDYDETHPEIIIQEESRWQENFSHIIYTDQPKKILDFGTGTGFVPATIGKFLTEEVNFTCADISQNMLNLTKQNIESAKLKGKFDYVKMDANVPFTLPFANDSFDLIMMNSVLHHIKDTHFFLSEISRICRPNGKIIIAHEPNKRFRKNDFLSAKYTLFHFFIRPHWEIATFLRKMGILQPLQQLVYLLVPTVKKNIRNKENITAEINAMIERENLHPVKLTKEEITIITDISAQEGFDPFHLSEKLFPLKVETYNHLFRVSIIKAGDPKWMWYEKIVKEKLPKDGATFFALYENRK